MVSVVIPVYNASKYLKRCIMSIINQTFTDIEIIAVNDGSQDDSLYKLLELKSLEPRMIVVDSPNRGGVVSARKKGVEHASGDFLCFVDSDDYLPNNAIDLLVNGAINGQSSLSDIVIASYTLKYGDSGKEKIVNNRKRFSDNYGAMSYVLNNGETFLPIKLYKTQLFRDNVDIPHDVIFQEDTIGIMQYLSACESVAYISDSVYYYYKHDRSASNNSSLSHKLSTLTVSEYLLDNYSSVGTQDLTDAIINTVSKNLYAFISDRRLARNYISRIDSLTARLMKINSGCGIRRCVFKINMVCFPLATVLINLNNICLKVFSICKHIIRSIL